MFALNSHDTQTQQMLTNRNSRAISTPCNEFIKQEIGKKKKRVKKEQRTKITFIV